MALWHLPRVSQCILHGSDKNTKPFRQTNPTKRKPRIDLNSTQ